MLLSQKPQIPDCALLVNLQDTAQQPLLYFHSFSDHKEHRSPRQLWSPEATCILPNVILAAEFSNRRP